MGKRNQIAVTSFVNPHLFWYHTIDEPSSNTAHAYVNHLEQQLAALFKNQIAPRNFVPTIGAKVVIYMLAWNKHIRGEVLSVEHFSHRDEFIVWAMDHGFSMQAKKDQLRPLPDKYSAEFDHIRCGGMANIYPAENDLDMVDMRPVMSVKDKWLERACTLLEKIMSDAAAVIFIENFKATDNHFWGDVIIVNHKGQEIKAVDYLKGMYLATNAEDEFRSKCVLLKTIQIPRWLSNNGKNNFRENNLKSRQIYRLLDDTPQIICDDFAKKKVEDWHARNERGSKCELAYRPSEALTEFEDDISFDDSASNQKDNSSCKKENRNSKGLTSLMAVKAKYAKNQLPPKPDATAFLFDDEQEVKNDTENLSEDALLALNREQDFGRCKPQQSPPMSTTTAASQVSTISARNQRLIELRNKMLSKPSETSHCSSGQYKYEQLETTPSASIEEPLDNLTYSARAKSLLKIRRKIAFKNDTPAAVQDEQNKTQLSVNFEKSDDESVVSIASSRKSLHLRNIRQKLREQSAEQQRATTEGKDSYAPNEKINVDINLPALVQKRDLQFRDIKASMCFNETNQTVTQTRQADKSNEIKMLPAGFDLMNVYPYNDEKNHWHCKKTTLNDYVPHDASVDLSEVWSPPVKQSADNTQVSNYSFSLDTSDGAINQTRMNENFRHTRAHTDKRKKETERDILDCTVPMLDMPILQPAQHEEQHQNKQLLPAEQQLDACTTLYNGRNKKRLLKSPASQKAKLNEIIRQAEIDQQHGDANILDLSGATRIESSDSNAEMFSADDGGEFIETKSSNKRALLESRLLNKAKVNEPEPLQIKSNIEAIKKVAALTPEQAKLERLAENLNFELTSLSKGHVIQMPQAQQLVEVDGETQMRTKFIDQLVLAHSRVPLNPLENLSDAFLMQEIHNEMVEMHLTKVYRCQSYVWPHLLRGNSAFIVNPMKSGKTWAYLPPVCSLVSYRLQNSMLPEKYGPVAIILVPSSLLVEKVSTLCKRLLVRFKDTISTVPSFGIRNAVEVKVNLLNTCGILVATPANLLRLLQENEHESLFDAQRLQYLVIDDMDIMLSRSRHDFENVLRTIFKLSRRSKHDKLPLQLVVTSRDWHGLLVTMMRRAHHPLLVMGDFLEAAVYGKAVITIKLRSSEQKIGTVLRFIDSHPINQERLIIFCNCSEDVENVVHELHNSDYPCIAYHSHSTATLRRTIDEWKLKNFCTQILVCTDDVFPELEIQNAQNLIHYSMPTSWTRFTSRFKSLAQSYTNFVAKDFECTTSDGEIVAHALILLDEANNMQLPRLIDFMRKHKQTMHPDILAVEQRVLMQREEERILKGTLLCPYVLEFGECDEPRCDQRHHFTQFDVITPTDDIPTVGDLRVLVLKVLSPTHYTARLLQHKSAKHSKWREVRCSNNAGSFQVQLNMHYKCVQNLKLHWPLHMNDLCVYKISETYHRVRLLEVPEFKATNVVEKVAVTVKLIDVGTVVTNVKSDELLHCDQKYKDFPAQAVDIRMVGIVPYDNERTWDMKATKVVQKWIMNDIKDNACVHVSINFALANTIWVNNVIVMEPLKTVGQYIYKVNLKRSLIEKEFALLSNMAQRSVRQLAEENGLLNEAMQSADDEAEEAEINMHETEQEEHETENVHTELCEQQVDAAVTSGVCESIAINQCIKESWCKLPLHRLFKVEIGDESENGNWSDIYMQCIDNAFLRKFNALSTLINEHIDKLKLQAQSVDQHYFDVSSLKPPQNCIVKYDERYLRAKIYGIFGDEISGLVYRFFLCDYACFVTMKAANCHNDFLYPTTKEILEFAPYQAVHFSLAGIKLERACKRYLVTKSYLFAYAVAEHQHAPLVIDGFEINSYDVLLYECDTDTDFNTENMVNKALLANKAAVLDENTQHLLDLQLGVELTRDEDDVNTDVNANADAAAVDVAAAEFNGGSLVNFQELLNCIQKSFELEVEDMIEKEVLEQAQVKKPLNEVKAICAAAIEHENERDETQKCKLQEIASKEKEALAEESKKTVVPKMHKNSRNAIERNLSRQPKETMQRLHSSFDTDEEPMLYSTASDNNSTTSSSLSSDVHVPLNALHKRPHTTWYQTDCLIYLTIHAPDIEDYLLDITKDTLIFAAIVNGEKQALVLNFLGTVEPEYVSHSLRGLNVIVRLVKSIYMKWPRLLQQSTKFSWLSYNFNAIDTRDIEHLLPQQQLHLVLENAAERANKNTYNSDTDSDDGERELYQTFTPIVNSEDIHDPTAELF